ncbi:MAG: thiosulfate oxidation carrier protein SoxY [Bacillota bacterium]
MKRRDVLRLGGAALGCAALGARAQASLPVQDLKPLIDKITGGSAPERGGIDIEVPQLAENGNAIPLRIKVPSPMSPGDRVEAIHVLAERNPRPAVAAFHFGPAAPRAEVATRVRLAATQNITVVAVLSGGRYRIADTEVVVASGACLDDSA